MRIRKHVALLLVSSVVPATVFVWLITDQFHARSVLEWHPGWVQNDDDFAAPFFQFWLMNFGIWVPLVFALIGLSGWKAWNSVGVGANTFRGVVSFLLPFCRLFFLVFLFKSARWDWVFSIFVFWLS